MGAELTERRSHALAVSYLAATELTLTRARGVEGEKAEEFLRERQAELLRRRQALFALAGEGPVSAGCPTVPVAPAAPVARAAPAPRRRG